MATSLALVKPESPRDTYADLTFTKWLLRLGKRLFVFVSAGWFIGFLSLIWGAISKYAFPEITKPQQLLVAKYQEFVLQIVTVVNFVVIFVILLFPPRGPKAFTFEEGEPELPDSEGSEREKIIREMCGYRTHEDWIKAKDIAVTVLRQFELVWMVLWVFWLLLSIPLLISSIAHASGFTPTGLSMARTLFSNCNTLTMVFCYEILAQPTTHGIRQLQRPEVNWFRWIAIVIFFTAIQVLLVNILHYEAMTVAFEWISGLCAATAFALFVGRLDSRYLSPPTWFLVSMYMYVAIQPVFPILGQPNPDYS